MMQQFDAYRLSELSEDHLLLEWKLDVDQLPTPTLALRLDALCENLRNTHAQQIVNLVPAYASLLIQFDSAALSLEDLGNTIADAVEDSESATSAVLPTLKLPVYYAQEVALDLESVCKKTRLSKQQLIDLHCDSSYCVYAQGFMPGFAYLGFVDAKIEVPRHRSFRGQLEAGSVAIADRQTAIYPAKSAGGWQVIGRVPEPSLRQLIHLRVGMQVRFEAIDRHQYVQFGGKI